MVVASTHSRRISTIDFKGLEISLWSMACSLLRIMPWTALHPLLKGQPCPSGRITPNWRITSLRPFLTSSQSSQKHGSWTTFKVVLRNAWRRRKFSRVDGISSDAGAVYCVLCTVYFVLGNVYWVTCTGYCASFLVLYCVLCTGSCTEYPVLCTVYRVLCTALCRILIGLAECIVFSPNDVFHVTYFH